MGKSFEDICKEFIISSDIFRLTKIGKWWYKDKEIDLVALNEQTKEILFGECKWQDKVDAKKVLEELKEKTKYVNWFNQEREEYFIVFARSFKEKIKEKNVYLFDLKDMEKLMK